jgi:hypothetical protein
VGGAAFCLDVFEQFDIGERGEHQRFDATLDEVDCGAGCLEHGVDGALAVVKVTQHCGVGFAVGHNRAPCIG